MSLRPSQAGIDVLRRALRPCRGPAAPLLRYPARSFATTSSRHWLFSRKKDEQQPAPVPAANQGIDADAVDHAIPPTEFQEKIAGLETRALESRDSDDPQPQIELMEALRDGNESNGLIRYYEQVALAPGEHFSPALLKSDEAFELYSHALATTGRLSELSSAVRKRDQRLKDEGLEHDGSTSSASAAQPASSAPASTPAPASTTASSTSTTAPAAASATASSAPTASSPGSILTNAAQRLTGSAQPAQQATSTTSSDNKNQSNAGTPLNPIHVQLAAATPAHSMWRGIRWLLGLIFWSFLALTVFSMFMENAGLMKAGPGPAEFQPEEGKTVKFSDVKGCEEAKQEVQEIVEFLRNPEKFSKLGGKLPKGVLLTGPPGTGKTLLARAIAGEAEVPFFFASGSAFDEMFVGVGAKRVRELFKAARAKAPAIVFIDELDAMGGKRSARDQQHMKQTLNQLLVELDGFDESDGIIVVAATNFPKSLDKALTRPGRFDRHVAVPLPDVRGRIEILKHHMQKIHYGSDVDPKVIARGTPGMSGADLRNLCNQAAIKASRDGAHSVSLKDFEWAKDRILMGAERKSTFIPEDARLMTAYHEGGHALAALYTPGADPLHKVTIMPRGHALGLTFLLPEADKYSTTRKEYRAKLDVAMGGRAAEELIYGPDEVTSGCASDLRNASYWADAMVRSFGMGGEKVGLGIQEHGKMSGPKRLAVEQEVDNLLNGSMRRVMRLLIGHEQELHRLAKALVEYEELDHREVIKVLRGEKLDREPPNKGARLQGQSEKRRSIHRPLRFPKPAGETPQQPGGGPPEGEIRPDPRPDINRPPKPAPAPEPVLPQPTPEAAAPQPQPVQRVE